MCSTVSRNNGNGVSAIKSTPLKGKHLTTKTTVPLGPFQHKKWFGEFRSGNKEFPAHVRPAANLSVHLTTSILFSLFSIPQNEYAHCSTSHRPSRQLMVRILTFFRKSFLKSERSETLLDGEMESDEC